MSASSDVRPSESIVTLAFEVADASIPVVATTGASSCQFVLEEFVPGPEGEHTVYYRIEGCDPEHVPTLAADEDVGRSRLIDRPGTGGVLKVSETGENPLFVLTAEGAVPRRMVVAEGAGRITVEVPPELDVNETIARFEAAYPDAELLVRRQEPYGAPVFGERGLEEVATASLTDRQTDVLRAAYREGFFEWPREITGDELSEQLGISAPTFHQHLRTAQKRLVDRLFADTEPTAAARVDESTK